MTQEEERKQPVTMTRKELYNQVWATPMSRLAAQYGITGNGLAKICDRHNIPYPPRGYWAKKAAGKPVVTYRLPETEDGCRLSVTIRPTPPRSKSSALLPETQARVDQARTDLGALVVPKRLARPHPIIAAWLADHELQKRQTRQHRDPWLRSAYDPGEFSAMDRRRHRILNTLFKALERRGAKIVDEQHKGLFAEMQGERIEFQIREKSKRVRRPLTSDELRFKSSSEKGWRMELQTTGKLVFAIKTYLPQGLRTEWLETEDKPLEALLSDIVFTILAAIPLLVERTRERQEAERQRRIAEQRRYEEEQKRKLDDNRWRRLTEFARQWRETELARDFLEALKRVEMESDCEIDGHPLKEWLAWAEQKLNAVDPMRWRPEEIFASIASVTSWTYRD